MSPNVFEINEDKIYKDKCCGEFYAMFFLVMLCYDKPLVICIQPNVKLNIWDKGT